MTQSTDNKCFACGRKLGKSPKLVDTRDGQTVYVGSECYKLVMAAPHGEGWQPPQGGPRLFPIDCTCPSECDCQNPEPESGVALVSNECPVHNWNPQIAAECPVHDPT